MDRITYTTMDDADLAQERAEKETQALMKSSRKPEGPAPTGACLWCGAMLTGGAQRWCDIDCSAEYQARQETLRKQGVKR